MSKLIRGVGVNDANYRVSPAINGVQTICPYYKRWTSMIERCYSATYQLRRPTYIGCTVCEEWKKFSAFRLWMEKQDWQGNELDKDLLIQGNKRYSPEACIFISREINTLLNDSKAQRGKYPRGVCLVGNKYKARVRINGGNKHLGLYDTPELAYDAYKIEKYKQISIKANQQSEPLKSALLNYKITG